MSKYLDAAIKSFRTPLCEGRGIKVFRLKENVMDEPMWDDDEDFSDLPDVTQDINRLGPHYWVDRRPGLKAGDDVKFILDDGNHKGRYTGKLFDNPEDKGRETDFELGDIQEL